LIALSTLVPIVGGIALTRSLERAPQPAPKPSPIESVVKPTPAPPADPPPPAAESLPREVQIKLAGVPRRARVLLDDRPVAGLSFAVTRNVKHRLVVKAKGFEEKSITFVPVSDQTFYLSLDRVSRRRKTGAKPTARPPDIPELLSPGQIVKPTR
jgi:hypothetical protein